MVFHKLLSVDHLGIVEETLKIFTKNGKTMALLTFLNISLCSILFLSIFFSIEPFIKHISANLHLLFTITPTTPIFTYFLRSIKENFASLFGLGWIFILSTNIVSLIHTITTITASATTYSGRNVTIKDLWFLTLKSLKKTLITWVYKTFFTSGYLFLVLVNLLPVFLIPDSLLVIQVLPIALVIFFAYLFKQASVVLNLGLVVSVLEEENHGMDALAKAARIVNGMRPLAVVINRVVMVLVVFSILGVHVMVVTLVPLQAIFRFEINPSSTAISIIIGLLAANSLWLVSMFQWMAYTMFYYKCKKVHGEEVEFSKGENQV